ncbi:MAG: symmetrical bis(5'-nucleosyl)-tetraphosphatase [Gammaproteobacteria bacterium]|nr:symmetrical bis(5'-nucleosyl)-tetraphosphatase [Gammaproteobacteria bacterium]
MAVYAVGDVQGCIYPFEKLLEKIKFDPGSDKLWLTGDLVNRGPNSLATLRLVKSLGKSAVTVLGNHDLLLLAITEKIKRNRKGDTLQRISRAEDIAELTDWLRRRPLVHCDRDLRIIMVHAGVYPGWSRKQLLEYAGEAEKTLQGKKYKKYLKRMYGQTPLRWNKNLGGWERKRFILNTLTRMRYCDRNRRLNFKQKGPPGSQPKRFVPWFDHPDLKCGKWRIVFGHWSSLGYWQRGNLISLDSGCVWGGKLTAVQLDADQTAPKTSVGCKAWINTHPFTTFR